MLQMLKYTESIYFPHVLEYFISKNNTLNNWFTRYGWIAFRDLENCKYRGF